MSDEKLLATLKAYFMEKGYSADLAVGRAQTRFNAAKKVYNDAYKAYTGSHKDDEIMAHPEGMKALKAWSKTNLD